MDRSRLRLDDPALQGRLSPRPSSYSYVRRPVAAPSKQIHDINAAGTPAAYMAPTLAQAAPAAQPQPVVAQVAPPQQVNVPLRQPVMERRRYVEAPVSQPDQASVEPIPTQFVVPVPKARRRKSTLVLYGMATFLLIAGIAVSVNGLLVNHQVSATVGRLTTKGNTTDSDSAAPSTVKPTDTAINNYAVSPNLPRYIDITKLGVHARVLSMGVNSKNELQAPGNVYDAGWYNSSSQPGLPGAMLVDGHISSWTTHGVFYGLNKLVVGDAITITRGDGHQFTYKVVRTAIMPSNQVDMSSLLVSQNTAKPGLNLISCSGDVIPGTNEFDKRIIVYTTLQ